FFRRGAAVIEVRAQTEHDLFRVENLAGVVRGAVLGAAAAFDAGVGLQADELGEIFSSDKAEVLITMERRNLAEAAARKKDGKRAEYQVQVLGMRDHRQKDEQRECVRPPESARRRTCVRHEESGEIRGHQCKDQQRNEARLPGEFAEPLRPHKEAANEEAENACCTSDSKEGGTVKGAATDATSRIEKAETKGSGAVIQRDQRKGAKGPEDQRMGEAGQRALADHLRLAHHLPEEIPRAFSDRR